jgi:hypothetical protein
MKGLFLIGGMLFAKAQAVEVAPPAEEACVARFAKIVAETEGWDHPDTLVRRQHNPGALRLKNGKYATYLTDQEGWERLRDNIRRLRSFHWKWIRIIHAWSEAPEKYEAAIAPRFRACMVEP